MAYELKLRKFDVKRQIPLPLIYKEVKLECAYRVDLVVKDILILELKTVDEIAPIHRAQLLTYMKLIEISKGLILNFRSARLSDGIIRMVL